MDRVWRLACYGAALVVTLALAGAVQARPAINGINASRTSGVAPLAVMFDAMDATDPSYRREFHSLHYEWTFDDPSSGTWSYSGKSRNQAIGPLAGHLFTRPGTYRVTLTVTNPAGQAATAAVTINVQDPATAYAGTRTTCVSSRGNFSGCPAGRPGW